MNDAIQPASGDAVSKQRAIAWLKDRRAKNETLKVEMASKGDYSAAALAQDNAAEINTVIIAFESGRFDIPSIPSPAEGRYKTALEDLRRMEYDQYGHSTYVSEFIDQALSPSGEQPVPSKSTMGLMTKETPLEALEQAIRDFPGDMTSGTSAKALIAWLESVTSFVYDKEEESPDA